MALTVTLDAPQNAQLLVPPTPQTVSCQCTVTGGAATAVEFYQGSTKIGDGVAQGGGVYTYSWPDVDCGSYGVWARANDGASWYESGQAIISVYKSLVSVVSAKSFGFETNDWTELESSDTGGGVINNWPYGELFDGGRVGAPGGARVTIVTDATVAREGSRYLSVELRQGDAGYGGLPDQNGTIDSSWLQWYNSELDHYLNNELFAGSVRTSDYLPGQSRSALLPPDADVVGREVYWAWSQMFPTGIAISGSDYFMGPNFHGGQEGVGVSGVPRYSGLTVEGVDKLVFYVTGSPTPGDQRGWLQKFWFNDDGSWYKTLGQAGSGEGLGVGDTEIAANHVALTKGIWYDFVVHLVWDGGLGGVYNGRFELWVQKNKSGIYKRVIPLQSIPTLSTFYSGGVLSSGRITPYFGLYRSRGVTAIEQIYLDSIRRRSTFADAMIPNSTLERAQAIAGQPAPAAPTNSALPAITGAVVENQTLQASTGTWTGNPTSYAYQWRRCDNAGLNCSSISGASAASYGLVTADIGSTMRVVVTATNNGGATSATSASTAVIVVQPGGTFGNATIGALSSVGGSGFIEASGPFTLNENGASITKLTAYLRGGNAAQNMRCIVYTNTVVSGANRPGSFVAVSSEVSIAAGAAPAWVAFTVAPSVSAASGDYWIGFWYGNTKTAEYYDALGTGGRYAAAAYSSTANPPASFGTGTNTDKKYSVYATYTVAATTPTNTVAPVVSGSTQTGSNLTVNNGTWVNSPTSYTYQWQRADDTAGTNLTSITGASAASYVSVTADNSKYLRCQVTATNAGGSATANSPYVGAISAPPSTGGTRPTATRVVGGTRVISGTRVVGGTRSIA